MVLSRGKGRIGYGTRPHGGGRRGGRRGSEVGSFGSFGWVVHVPGFGEEGHIKGTGAGRHPGASMFNGLMV